MRVLLFGDSHLAAVRSGLNEIEVPSGLQLDFWGTPGHRFRHISWKDGQIVPDDEAAAAAFARFNRNGMTRLDPAAFDAVVFVGVRIRPGAVLPDVLNHVMHPGRHLSRDYIRRLLAEHYRGHFTYEMAREMARDGKTRVLMNLVSLDTQGKAGLPRQYALARRATTEDIARIWDLTRQILAEDGITFVPQPLDTIALGYHTKPEYGVDGKDAIHKNAAYGAAVLSEIFAILAGPGLEQSAEPLR